jgi:hypothetical protein
MRHKLMCGFRAASPGRGAEPALSEAEGGTGAPAARSGKRMPDQRGIISADSLPLD